MKIFFIGFLLPICAMVGVVGNAHANGFNWQIQYGPSHPTFLGDTQDVRMNNDTVNQYSFYTPSQSKRLFGTGFNYQFDYRYLSLSLGLSGYYTRSAISGVNTPFINAGGTDTLNYSANDTSYAMMFEPKFIWNTYVVQPYLLTGIGLAYNHVDNYSETKTDPNSSAVPTPTPFNSATTRNIAREIGVGMQYALPIKKYAPILTVDYRVMYWGEAELSTYTGQPINSRLNFGRFRTTAVTAGLMFPL